MRISSCEGNDEGDDEGYRYDDQQEVARDKACQATSESALSGDCLLYTSDAADETLWV